LSWVSYDLRSACDNPGMSESRKSWLSVAVLVLLLLVLAALRPLSLPDEGRYADIGRWMLVSGDWLTPRLNGIPFFHKPAYLYWLEASAMGVLGVHAWSARLVVALHAAMMLVVSYLAMRHIASEKLARNAVWMLGSSLSFLIGGQYVNHDMLVAAWISVALWCFALAFMHGDKPHAWLARAGFAACAFGMLSKGLIGFALPGLVLLIWLLVTQQMRKVLYVPWISGLLIFCAIALPWFILAQMQHDQMLQYMFGKHNVSRYTGSTFNNVQPFWFYGVVLLLLFFPWIFFAVYQAIAQLKKAPIAAQTIAKQYLWLLWIWLLAIVIFFSIPSSKIVGYMLPVMPALAALAALGWQQLFANRVSQNKWFAGLCALALAIAVVANVAAARLTQKHSAQDVAQHFACIANASDTVYAVGDFPYDFPFYAQTRRPMVVVQDWPDLRKNAGDNWRSELLEGADFDARAGQVLQTPDVLAAAATQARQWLVAPNNQPVSGFALVLRGKAWSLYQSQPAPDAKLPAEGPKPAQHKGLPGCTH
jgi:4-amino-4-deoxy-L-arabinose transferase-like glycosyltransferase